MYVYLIGAGPGDPGLITRKGMEAMGMAQVVVYDYLAGDEILGLAPADAEYIYVGKKAGNHALPQDKINELLVEKAREGKIVARLKGGDPYIFGRGGEEAEELVKAGIPFEEIPGISSTVAGPAYAGIPLTHRAFSSSVTIITGHEDPTKPDSVHNWEALAKSGSTLVFVMGMKNLPSISHNLIEAGLDPATPAALIHWGTTDHQRSLAATLATLPDEAVRQGFSNPSVIVVGQVVSLRDRLNWFEQRPLFGRGVIITRAREQASDSAARFARLGARVTQFPAIAIRPLDSLEYALLDDRLKTLREYDWILFTSANAVRFFRQRLAGLALDARALSGIQVAALGSATAEAVRGMGIEPDFVPEAYVAESAAQGLIARGMSGKRVLLPRAKQARDVLPQELEKAGAVVDIAPVYETVPDTGNKGAVLAEMEAGRVDCVTFGSSSTVRNFMDAIGQDTLRAHPEIKLACIGPVTADTLRGYGFEPAILPVEYTVPALVDAVCAAIASGAGGESVCR